MDGQSEALDQKPVDKALKYAGKAGKRVFGGASTALKGMTKGIDCASPNVIKRGIAKLTGKGCFVEGTLVADGEQLPGSGTVVATSDASATFYWVAAAASGAALGGIWKATDPRRKKRARRAELQTLDDLFGSPDDEPQPYEPEPEFYRTLAAPTQLNRAAAVDGFCERFSPEH